MCQPRNADFTLKALGRGGWQIQESLNKRRRGIEREVGQDGGGEQLLVWVDNATSSSLGEAEMPVDTEWLVVCGSLI